MLIIKKIGEGEKLKENIIKIKARIFQVERKANVLVLNLSSNYKFYFKKKLFYFYNFIILIPI